MNQLPNEKIEELFENFGLSKSEVRLYLTNLSLGPASAIQLSQRLGLTRQMIYNLLPGLSEKGLLKQIKIGQKNLFQALPPQILLDRARLLENDLKTILPVLQSRQAENNAVPQVTIYENPLAMRDWYRQFMNEAKKDEDLLIWSTGKVSYWYDLDQDFYDKYLDYSNKAGVKTYVLIPKDKESKEHQERVARKNTHYKFVDHHWSEYAEKWVWGNQVCYLSIKENATNMIVIESDTLSKIERFDFWEIWGKR